MWFFLRESVCFPRHALPISIQNKAISHLQPSQVSRNKDFQSESGFIAGVGHAFKARLPNHRKAREKMTMRREECFLDESAAETHKKNTFF